MKSSQNNKSALNIRSNCLRSHVNFAKDTTLDGRFGITFIFDSRAELRNYTLGDSTKATAGFGEGNIN